MTPKAEIDAFVAGLERFPDVAILSDEIYGQMTYDGLAHTSLLTYPSIRDRLIMLDGWSKTYAMTGWRMGYAVWPDALIDKMRKLAVNCWSCVNAPAQWAGLEALTGPQDAVPRHGGGVRPPPARRGRGAERACRAFGPRRRRAPSTPSPTSPGRAGAPKPLASALLEEAGVATIGGPDFGVHGEGFIRLSYANSLDNIERALERMRQFPVRASAGLTAPSVGKTSHMPLPAGPLCDLERSQEKRPPRRAAQV